MELARMTSKGQLTVPVSIRKKLGLETGDSVLFYEKDGQIIISGVNPVSLAKAQIASAENHIYSLEEIRQIAVPIVKEHGAEGLSLFGSYARGEARRDSDLDFILERGRVRSLLALSGLQTALSEAFHKSVDILPQDSLEEEFRKSIERDRVMLYDGNEQG